MVPHTRELLYFVAVAEEGTFTAAAVRLRLSQQSISAAVRQLERRVGVPLLERHGRGVRPTVAGEEFLAGAREVLAATERLVERARSASRPRTVRLGYPVLAAAELTTPLLVELQRQRPELTLQLRLADYDDPSAGLRDGSVDVALLRRPVGGDLAFENLFCERRVAAVSVDHPAAQREEVGIEELAGLPVIDDPGPDQVWSSFWRGDDLRGARPVDVLQVESFEDELAAVALGQAWGLTSAAAARFYPRPGVSYVPVTGADPCVVALAWDPDRPPAALDAVIAAARSVRTRAHADGTFRRLGWLEPPPQP